MSDEEEPTYSYGTGEAARLRRIIHEYVIAQRLIPDALPTTVRSVYYVGEQTGLWPTDEEFKLAKIAAYEAAGAKVPSTIRLISQNLSDHIQWLIDAGYIGEDEIVDESAQTFSLLGTDDLVEDVTNQARFVPIDPWSPEPVPYLLAEGKNDMTFIAPIGRRNRCHWAPLGGMAGRSMLRKVAREISSDAPVGYVGDWNKAGSDIERNAEAFLRSKGWDGTWTRIAVTDAQAAGLTPKFKIDRRFKTPVPEPSVESAAMSVVAIRAAIQAWLDAQKPTVPDVDDDDRDDLVEWLGLFTRIDDGTDPDDLELLIERLVNRRRP